MKKLITLPAIALISAFSIHAQATPISFDSAYGFSWSGDGIADEAIGAEVSTDLGLLPNPGASPWTFDGAGSFVVIDLEEMVDRFSVYDNGDLLGVSSEPLGGDCGTDVQVCIDTGASIGFWFLGEGSHSITIDVNGGNSGNGLFALNAPEVPIPAAAWLFGSALLGLGVIKRKKA